MHYILHEEQVERRIRHKARPSAVIASRPLVHETCRLAVRFIATYTLMEVIFRHELHVKRGVGA